MFDAASRIVLPQVPPGQVGEAVAAWSDPVEILSYEPAAPDRYPAFLETRVYQGSSGHVYPMPYIEAISDEPGIRSWQAVHLENEYLRIVVLPELGGRIHIAVDKTTGRDMFYRNNVIKPALVGLAGPWIAGGVEFNWPQHHRPATYLPADWAIERESSGAVTVWLSDHDPFTRMKGMHGIRLRPGSSVIEARVRLFNRTEVTQTFLWWANVAARVHDDYQSFFPTDVTFVADHAKRAISTFPRATARYYGVDYPTRVDAEHPDADRLDWYRNIPVPTSYMCVGTDDDFFGGYDHATQLGFVHVADHRIAPGKKQWTWGNAPFGWAWDRNLSDGDGPYIELMAGVYTDNQPDFSYLLPGETKTFSQYWFPIHEIGVVHQATNDFAVSMSVDVGDDGRSTTRVRLGIESTSLREAAVVELVLPSSAVVWTESVSIEPGRPLVTQIEIPGSWSSDQLTFRVREDDRIAFAWTPRPAVHDKELPDPATAVDDPKAIESSDELYFAGLHLAQYRHATRSPEPYWLELLRRDPLDSRANVALARRRYDAGLLAEAEELVRSAIARSSRRNPNPSSGEAHYLLGVILISQGKDDEAYDALAKSAWNAEWRVPARLALARIDARASRWRSALDNAVSALHLDPDNLQAANVAVIAARRLGQSAEADSLLKATRTLDPLDWWSADLSGRELQTDAMTLNDIAIEYETLGAAEDALRVLDAALTAARANPVLGAGNPVPLIHYRRARLLDQTGRAHESATALIDARTCDAELCFVRGMDDAALIEWALQNDRSDARAHALLGHWQYFVRRYSDAFASLTTSADLDGSDPVVWRGLGLAAFNVQHDPERAAEYFAKARRVAGDDGKVLYESDQLSRRRAVPVAQRLAVLSANEELVARRDDLSIVYAELLAVAGAPRRAIEWMSERRFHPWEGGEGEALRVWSLAQSALAADEIESGRPHNAVVLLQAALQPPENLGEARHALANCSDLLLAHGDALAAEGDLKDAQATWLAAAASAGDFTTMAPVPYSAMTYYSALAAARLGDRELAERLRNGLAEYLDALRTTPAQIDYFATSLPNLLIFHDDPASMQRRQIALLEAQLDLLDGRSEAAKVRLRSLLEDDPANSHAVTLLRSLIRSTVASAT
jgi:tetratricopeptide (TPR) repeat protein